MLNFQPFPLVNDEKTTQVSVDIQAICLKVAQDNRGVANGAYIVQHSQAELIALYEIAAGIHDTETPNGHALQCGLFCGGSAIMMAHALRDDATCEHPLIAIDSYTKDYRPLRELFDNAYFEMRENLWEFRLHDHITAVLSDTVSFLKSFWNFPIRMAFIDSSHHYEPTRKELELILPHLVEGGWLILHDYFSEETPGVSRAVNEVFESKGLNNTECYQLDQLAIFRMNLPSDDASDKSESAATPKLKRPRHLPR